MQWEEKLFKLAHTKTEPKGNPHGHTSSKVGNTTLDELKAEIADEEAEEEV